MLLLAFACSWRAGTAKFYPSPADVRVDVAPHVRVNLLMAHYRLYAHSVYDDHEWGWCLEGHAEGNTIYVTDLVAGDVTLFSRTSATFACRNTPRFIGLAHNHVPTTDNGDACAHSLDDIIAQESIPTALVSIVTCGEPVRFMTRLRADWPQHMRPDTT